jgi:uncharacterized protein (DUF2236 family)
MDRNRSLMVIQRVNSERVVLLGWSRAILLQLAHPLVAAGVIQHSSFRGGVLEAAARLQHTVAAMLWLTFGDDQQRAAAVSRIRAIHRTVKGTLPVDTGPFPAGTQYSAEDPALLLWVHATLLDSTAGIYQRVVTPLSSNDLDQLCVESAPLLEQLGGNPAATPRTWRALQAYLAESYEGDTLWLTDDARALGTAVLSPRAAGVPLPLSGLHRLIATGLLPASIRQAYGFHWNAAREARFQRALNLLRAAREVMPGAVAFWPQARRWKRESGVSAAQP